MQKFDIDLRFTSWKENSNSFYLKTDSIQLHYSTPFILDYSTFCLNPLKLDHVSFEDKSKSNFSICGLQRYLKAESEMSV